MKRRKGSPEDRWVAEDRGFETPCHIWQGAVDKAGYGRVWTEERTLKLSHRFFYERVSGPVPHGMELHHRCGVPACVNAEHIEAVSRAEHNAITAREAVRLMIPCVVCGTPVESKRNVPRYCSQKCKGAKNAKPCIDCGEPTCGQPGKNAPERCIACSSSRVGKIAASTWLRRTA